MNVLICNPDGKCAAFTLGDKAPQPINVCLNFIAEFGLHNWVCVLSSVM